MARFYLNLRQADELVSDQEGSDLVDVDAAKAEAIAAAREVGADNLRHASLSIKRTFEIVDDGGALVAVVVFANILTGLYQNQTPSR